MVAAEAFVDIEAGELIIRARKKDMPAGWVELAVPLAFNGWPLDAAVLNAEDAPLCVVLAMRELACVFLSSPWEE